MFFLKYWPWLFHFFWLFLGAFITFLLFLDLFPGTGHSSWRWALLCTILPCASAFVFIAFLRVQGLVKYSFRKIGFTCPHCSHHGLPHFRCPTCQAIHPNLQSGLKGVFFTPCPNGHLLPTADVLGRLGLPMVCPRCSQDLSGALLGDRSEFKIAIVGATRSGKTNVLYAALWQLIEVFGPRNDVVVTFGSRAEVQAFNYVVDRLRHGEPMPKTPPLEIPKALTIGISDGNRECTLHLYDAAGEDFEDEMSLDKHPIGTYDGILFVVDPFAEEGVVHGILDAVEKKEADKAFPASQPASVILGRLINVLERRFRLSPGKRILMPIAVTVTKVDVCDLGKKRGVGNNSLHGIYASIASASSRAEMESKRVRELLLDARLGNLVQIFEARFEKCEYFAVASLCPIASPTFKSDAFRPRGVLAPFIWLCHETNALSDVDTFEFFFVNSHVYVIRALRGLEGARIQISALVTLVACVVLAVLGVLLLFALSVPPLLMFLAGGFQLGVLAILYVILAIDLVYRRYR